MRIRIRNRDKTLHGVSLWMKKCPKGVTIKPNRRAKDSVMWTHEGVDITFPTSIVEICGENRGSDNVGQDYSDYADLFLEEIDIGHVDCREYVLLEDKK